MERSVVATIERSSTSIVKIVVGADELIVDTEHQFYLPKQNLWVEAGRLVSGQLVMNAAYEMVAIDEITVIESREETELIDLSVEGNHNFYITQSDILVHNFAMAIFAPFVPVLGPAAGAAIIAVTVFQVAKDSIDDHNRRKEQRKAKQQEEERQEHYRREREKAEREGQERQRVEQRQKEAKEQALRDKTQKQLNDEIKNLPANERVPIVRETTKAKAEKYGWNENMNLKKKNQGRDIYTDKDGNHWSVDTQHGEFEKLDKKGRHQGAFDIDLNPIKGKGPDMSGRHDIKV